MSSMGNPITDHDFLSTVHPLWRVAAWPANGIVEGSKVYNYDGAAINPFNGGEPDELVVTRYEDQGWTEVISYRIQAQLVEWQTSELRLEAENTKTGEKVLLIIAPAERPGWDEWVEEYRHDGRGLVAEGRPWAE